MIRHDDFRLVPRWFGRTEPTRTRPPEATPLDVEKWLRNTGGWTEGLEDRLTASRRLLFVRRLVDRGVVSDSRRPAERRDDDAGRA